MQAVLLVGRNKGRHAVQGGARPGSRAALRGARHALLLPAQPEVRLHTTVGIATFLVALFLCLFY